MIVATSINKGIITNDIVTITTATTSNVVITPVIICLQFLVIWQ